MNKAVGQRQLRNRSRQLFRARCTCENFGPLRRGWPAQTTGHRRPFAPAVGEREDSDRVARGSPPGCRHRLCGRVNIRQRIPLTVAGRLAATHFRLRTFRRCDGAALSALTSRQTSPSRADIGHGPACVTLGFMVAASRSVSWGVNDASARGAPVPQPRQKWGASPPLCLPT